MIDSYSLAYEHFLNYKNTLYTVYREIEMSESDTRSKILDHIFINILNWSEFDVVREPRVDSGYIDYLFSTSTFKFAVEAKKKSFDLILPSRSNKTLIKTIYTQNKEVIDQIRRYLFDKGLQVGIITNGDQFIIGRFVNIDGQDWKNNNCIYYKNLEDIEKNFTTFYELLSREFVGKNGTIKIVQENKKGKTLFRDIELRYKDQKLVRNEISAELIPILTRVFEEIYKTNTLDQIELIKKCYVNNEDIKKYNYELGTIFADIPPSFHENIAQLQNTKNTQNAIKAELLNTNIDFTPDPIVLIGTAGAGKTTFIKNFIDIELDERVKKIRPILYLDFRLYVKQQIQDTKFIYGEMLNYLYSKYESLNLEKINVLKTIYYKEIQIKKDVEWSYISSDNQQLLEEKVAIFLGERKDDFIKHLESISKYLITKNNKRLCIIFDNVDQLDDEDQTAVFILSQSISRYLNCIVLISLREGYYFKWKDMPPINAYQSTVYHITAPPYKEVLKRRVQYVLDNFTFNPVKISLDNKKVGFSEGSLSNLFNNLYNSLFKTENSEILHFLEETSYPNIREGLKLFKLFLLSSHSKVKDYMSINYSPEGRGGIPFWEFIKSVALDSSYYYVTKNSKIFNLFYPSEHNTNHFTKLRILFYLKDIASKSTKKLKYIKVTELYNDFFKIGYSLDVIIEELDLLLTNKLITTTDYSADIKEEVEISEENKIAISSIGYYYITTLINKFTYYDLILQDTPIYNDDYFLRLSEKFPQSDEWGNRELIKRKEVSLIFLEYLLEMEKKDFDKLDINNINECLDLHIMESISNNLKNEFDQLDKRITKMLS
jgi:GTPase SAR1 family protein